MSTQKTYTLVLILWFISEVTCYNSAASCNVCKSQYTRIKRAKYYSSGPPKFFKLPPAPSPISGPFSYTPPPGYLMNNGASGPPSNLRPYKVSKRQNDGLAEDDIRNIVKYLSKQDLNKILELAVEKERYSDRYRVPSQNKYNNDYDRPTQYKEHKPFYKGFDEDYDMSVDPNSQTNDDSQTKTYDYSRPIVRSFPNDATKFVKPENPPNDHFINQASPLDELMSVRDQATFLDAYIQREMNGLRPDRFLKNNNIMQDDTLQNPPNVHDQDYEVSYTNNVPRVIKADSSSYKLENFADLPLMNYDSKLDVVNSYNVPHYTVTQPKKTPVQSVLPPLESAPGRGAAQDQSDAHLKAIKIWTHKSRGSAYTLHDDGTLSPEQPLRPKFHS